MKKVLGPTTIFLLLAFNFKDSLLNHTLVNIVPGSSLTISGTTNISSFRCDFDIDRIKESIPVHYAKIGRKYIFEKATLILNNQGFDCGNKGIKRDFHELLQSGEYPRILLRLNEIDTDISFPSVLNAIVEIKIAGNKNYYKIPVIIDENKTKCVSGVLKISLGDFNLKAPRKALGLIVVQDSVTISFDLTLRED